MSEAKIAKIFKVDGCCFYFCAVSCFNGGIPHFICDTNGPIYMEGFDEWIFFLSEKRKKKRFSGKIYYNESINVNKSDWKDEAGEGRYII